MAIERFQSVKQSSY